MPLGWSRPFLVWGCRPVYRWLIVVAAGAVLMLGGCGTTPEPQPTGPAATAAVSPVFNDADLAFVRALIPQHRQGVEIARIGAERASRPEMRVLASAIVTTQQDEVARLAGWLKAWQQPSVASSPAVVASPSAPGGTSAGAVAALGKAPAAGFDKAFLDLMIAQQDAAVRLARTETGAGRNPNALAFARQVDASRTAEIQQMRATLAGILGPK
jgi:uncharacterized protein (DUF305 family)